MHGCGKVEYENGDSYWGDKKEHMREGYATEVYASGSTFMGQYMHGIRHGYGILRWSDGVAHYG
jgi:hypothetical protein